MLFTRTAQSSEQPQLATTIHFPKREACLFETCTTYSEESACQNQTLSVTLNADTIHG